MNPSPRTRRVHGCRGLLALVAVLAVAGCSGSEDPPVQPQEVVRTTVAGLPAPSGEPTLAAMASAHPRPGTVLQVTGPFDDRFRLVGAKLAGHTVSGRITVTSDVSDILELQVVVGFHDASGQLVGTGRWTHHLVEDEHSHPAGSTASPNESLAFTVTIPERLRARAVSASVGVPVLVNE